MDVLISSYDDLCTFNLADNSLNTIESENKYYYGITWDKYLNLYLSHTNLNIKQLSTRHSPNQDCGVITSNRIKKYNFIAAPHQLNYYDDVLVLANTGRNCITLFDQKSRKDYYPDSNIIWDTLDGKKMGMHFNSIFKFKDKLYVLAHNFDFISEIYTLNWSNLVVEKVEQLSDIKWSHSMWVTEDFFIVGGGFGQLYDFKNDRMICEFKNDVSRYITRGFAANKDYLLVGCSPHITNKKLRYTSKLDVFISIFDIKSDFKYLDSIVVKDKTAINEIRLLNEIDLCHNDTIMTTNNLNNIFK